MRSSSFPSLGIAILLLPVSACYCSHPTLTPDAGRSSDADPLLDARPDVPSEPDTGLLCSAPPVPSPRRLSVDADMSCEVRADGSPWCWGRNEYGLLGRGFASLSSGTPAPVAGLADVSEIATSYFHSCALANGEVWCWGALDPFVEPILVPERFPTGARVLRLVGGAFFSCALAETRSVSCWGNNVWGELGRGGVFIDPHPMPTDPIPDPVVDIAAGSQHACALTARGEVWCWGSNREMQIGLDSSGMDVLPPTRVPLEECVTRIWVGFYTTCAKTSSGTVLCWGVPPDQAWWFERPEGVLPQRFDLVEGIVDLSLGPHSCAIVEDGELWCWGNNERGAVGLGFTSASEPPQPIGFIASEVSTGLDHTCARSAIDGRTYCWGSDGAGAVGTGRTTFRTTPAAVHGLDDVVDLDLAGSTGIRSNTACAVRADGTVHCWGGDQRTVTHQPASSPTAIPIGVASTVSVGALHSCALTGGGPVCWGYNSNGQLGVADPASRGPVSAPATGLSELAVGYRHTCGLWPDGTARCWGRGEHGQLGTGRLDDAAAPGRVIPVGEPVRALSAGGWLTCLVGTSGNLYCSGDNFMGQVGLGYSSDEPISSPRRLASVEDAVAVSAHEGVVGTAESCALTGAGVPHCWGRDPLRLGYTSPAPITGLTEPIRDIDVGGGSVCAVGESGAIWCWGYNLAGQLGNGTTETTWTPVRVSDVDDAVQIAMGYDAACARRADGTVACWGSDHSGALGQGSEIIVTEPRAVLGEAEP